MVISEVSKLLQIRATSNLTQGVCYSLVWLWASEWIKMFIKIILIECLQTHSACWVCDVHQRHTSSPVYIMSLYSLTILSVCTLLRGEGEQLLLQWLRFWWRGTEEVPHPDQTGRQQQSQQLRCHRERAEGHHRGAHSAAKQRGTATGCTCCVFFFHILYVFKYSFKDMNIFLKSRKRKTMVIFLKADELVPVLTFRIFTSSIVTP